MRILILVLLFIAAVLAVFAYWAMTTLRGNHAFGEMAGMIPLGAALVAAVLCVAAAGIWAAGRLR